MEKPEFLFYLIVLFVLGISAYMYYQKGDFQLKCIISDVDGNKYCVREREKIKDAVNLLAKVVQKIEKFIDALKEKYPDDARVQRLAKNFNAKAVNETLPTSTYTAYSENKGQKTAFCLNRNSKEDNSNLIDEHTLTFVAIHEISHVCTKSLNHSSEFWENFSFLLDKAKTLGIHEPKDYKKEPQEYCGMTIHDNPFYDIS
jgi:predicted metal-dependent hydrolase